MTKFTKELKSPSPMTGAGKKSGRPACLHASSPAAAPDLIVGDGN
jgi:hypothetical protein